MSYSVQTTPISRWKGYEDEDEEGGEGTKMKMEEEDMEDDEMARLHTDEEMPDVFNDLMQTPSISLSESGDCASARACACACACA
jgi:hypothetical protein